MTTTAIQNRALVDVALGRSRLGDIVVVAAGAGLIGLLAQVAVPLWPVPITGQTLAVLLVAAATGLTRGVASVAVYVALGAAGVPWYSGAAAGWHVLVGPTGGYLIGFLLAAAIVGWASDHGLRRLNLGTLLTYAGASAIVFVPGIAWLALTLHLTLEQSLVAGLYPFLIGGVVKALIATGLLPLMWRGAARLDARRTRD